MQFSRYWTIDRDGKGLTKEEIKVGWHFCPDWDFMLIGPGMDEISCCTCKKDVDILPEE